MNENTSLSSQLDSDKEEIDFVKALDFFLKNKNLILGITLVCLGVGALYAFLARPIYQSNILIQVEDSPEGAAAQSLLGSVSSLFDVKSTAAAEMQVLSSRLVVSRAVDELHLYIDAEPARFPIVGNWLARHSSGLSRPGLFGVGGFTWGREKIDVPIFDVPDLWLGEKYTITLEGNQGYVLTGPELDAPVKGIVGKPLDFASGDGHVKLLVASVSGLPAAKFHIVRSSRLSTITDLQDALNVQEQVKQSNVIVGTLKGPDADLVALSLNAIANQYVSQNVQRKSLDAAQSLDFLNQRLPGLKRQLYDAEDRFTDLRNRGGLLDFTQEARVDLEQSAATRLNLLQLKQQRDALATRFAPSHPAILALDRQIAALSSFDQAGDQKINRLPNQQRDAVRAELDVRVATDLYTGLLNNIQQLELVKAGKIGTVRLVDGAAVAEKPVQPKKALVLGAALFVGFVLGALAAYIKEAILEGVSDPSDIEIRTGLPIYATVPRSERQEELSLELERTGRQTGLLSVLSPNDVAAESLRSLRTAFQFSLAEAKNNIVVITGPTPEVGKSFISSNFAAILASTGMKVLLVDADLRKGYLNKIFGLPRDNGFTELVNGTATVSDVLHKNVVEGLDFITTGVLPPNPAELLLRRSIATYLEEFSRDYDVVIVDTPPVLAVADTVPVAAKAGVVFLLALEGKTRVGDIKESQKRLEQSGVMVSGVIFNGMRASRLGSKYGSYSYRYYAYEPRSDA